jgi:hypothetical protein
MAGRPPRSNATSSSVGPPQRVLEINRTDAPAAIAVRDATAGPVPSRACRPARSVERAASAVQDETDACGRRPESQRQVRCASLRRLLIATRLPWIRCDLSRSAITLWHFPRW